MISEVRPGALACCFMLALLLIIITIVSAPAAYAARNQAPIKVLIVDGFSNHDWKMTTALLRGILQPAGLFQVSVSTAPETATSPGWDQWRPKFSYYDVVIQTCNDIGGWRAWSRALQTAMEAFGSN